MKLAGWRFAAIITLMAVVGASLAFWLANGRPGATYDTAFYLSSSNHLLAGDGLITDMTAWNGSHLTEPLRRWPPGYPVLWTGAALLSGLRGLQAGLLVSALAFGFCIVAAGVLGRRFGGPGTGIGAAALTLTSIAMWQTGSAALSDMVYTALVAWSVVLLTAHAQDGRQWRLWVSAGLAALATLTRWVGLAVAIAGGLWLVAEAVRRRRWVGLAEAVGYGLVVVGPNWLYQQFVPLFSGEGALLASAGVAPPLKTLISMARVVAGDFGVTPIRSPSTLVFAGARALMIALVLAMVVWGIARWWRHGADSFPALMLPGAISAAVYIAIVCYARSVQYVPAMTTRYLVAFYPWFFASAAGASALLWQRAHADKRTRTTRALAWVTIGALVCFPLWTAMPKAVAEIRAGVGLSAPRWREGAGFALVRTLKPDVVVSPTAGYVYLQTGIPSRPPGIGMDAAGILAMAATPPLAGKRVLIVVADPDAAWVRAGTDVVGLLDPTRFDVLFHSRGELVVAPRR
jgi:hypothetical protein